MARRKTARAGAGNVREAPRVSTFMHEGETFFVFHGAVGTSGVAGCGRYVDYFRKVDGSWKLVYRRVVPDVVPVGDDGRAYWQASRDRGDPSYDRRRGPDEGGLPS